jgi:4-hydroxybenzoate polyprenyltransferase
MRSAGCIINDLWDQTYDRNVIRTSSRPIANGTISNRNAILYLGLHLSIGLGVLLSLPHQYYCFQWGVPSLLLVGIYPTMKRFFPYPQAFLGMTFNWGCFMGWAAVCGTMNYSVVLPLYGSGITWTIVYDTIYGHQDKKDDMKLGLYSTAITFGNSEIHQKRILYSLATVTFFQWILVGYQVNLLDSMFYDFGILSAYGHLLWQIRTADFENPKNCLQRFTSNNTVGGIIFAAITTGKYLA